MSDAFLDDLAAVLNKHCVENPSNTPDFVLAQCLAACLAAWNTGTQQRETWYGRDARPSLPPTLSGAKRTAPVVRNSTRRRPRP